MSDLKEIPQAVTGAFTSLGLDIQALGRTDALPESSPLRQGPNSAGDRALLLIGNSRRMWDVFLNALRSNPGLLDDEHPLDSWLTRMIPALLGSLGEHLPEVRNIFYPWEAEERRLDFQELGRRVGLAARSPSGLSVHQRRGPWIAWRAAIVFDALGPPLPKPATEPCNSCTRPCLPLYEALLSRGFSAGNWRSWLAIRDSCPVGREHRYSEEQILYHYMKDTRHLRNLLEIGEDGQQHGGNPEGG